MITLKVFRTAEQEEELLFLLIARGRHADIPYYMSVDSFDLEKGLVIFTRLDCAPSPFFKVAVAGGSIIVSETYEHHVVEWLNSWNIKYRRASLISCRTADEAISKISEIRALSPHAKVRNTYRKRLIERIKDFQRAEDSFLLG